MNAPKQSRLFDRHGVSAKHEPIAAEGRDAMSDRPVYSLPEDQIAGANQSRMTVATICRDLNYSRPENTGRDAPRILFGICRA